MCKILFTYLMLIIFYAVIFSEAFGIQYVSAVFSFTTMILSATMYEKARKERLRKASMGPIQTICVFLYYGLIIIARVLAVCVFGYFYR